MKTIILLPIHIIKFIIHLLSKTIKTIFFTRIDMKMIDEMSGIQFEQFIKDLLKRSGYQDLSLSSQSGDFGIDIFASKNYLTYGFQCKRYKRKIGVDAIQQVYSGCEYYALNVPVVITNSTFSMAAITLAKNTDVVLIDRHQLIKMMKKAKMYRALIPFYYHLIVLMLIGITLYSHWYIVLIILVFLEIIMSIRTIMMKRKNHFQEYHIHEYKNESD